MKMKLLLTTLALSLAAPMIHAADSLVVYSGRKDTFVKPVFEEFTKKTGIEVVVHAGESTALLNKLRLEGARSEADVYISNDSGNLDIGNSWGLFEPLPAKITEQIPAQYHATNNSWIGLSGRLRVLVVNTQAKDIDFVKSVFDLADPRLEGKVGVINSANESFIGGVSVYVEEKGAEATKNWLKGLKKNTGKNVYSKHAPIVEDVASGKLAVGLVNHYYIYRHLAEHPDAPIRILLPDQGDKDMGIAWNVTGAAVVKASKHKEAALKLVAYLVSEEGQKAYSIVNSEYPTRANIPAAPTVPAHGSFKTSKVPLSVLGNKRAATLDLIESVGMP
ncbi:MAG: extracellular solute-binding protein [Pseudomonadota bacterium]